MTAAGLDFVSDGRFTLGLGASGPQVIEGWHGVPYDAPLQRTREVVEICRQVWRRERLEHAGKKYTIPLPPEQGTGLGKPLKLINTPVRSSASRSCWPRWARRTSSWPPRSPRSGSRSGSTRRRPRPCGATRWPPGKAKRDPSLGELQVLVGVPVAIGDDVDALHDHVRPALALYVGGMGARGKNFYNDLAVRYGFEAEAKTVQDLYLDGKKDEAAAALPDELVRAVSLIGPESYVAERIAAFAEAGVTTLAVQPMDPSRESRLRPWRR